MRTLNALAVPPSDPFEVEVDVTMTNDENLEKTGTVIFTTALHPEHRRCPCKSDGGS